MRVLFGVGLWQTKDKVKSTSTIAILQIEINGSLLLKFQSSALKISQKAIEMTSNAVEIPHSYNSSIDIGILAMSAHFASFPLNTSSFIL